MSQNKILNVGKKSKYIYIYIYIYMCMCVCVSVYVFSTWLSKRFLFPKCDPSVPQSTHSAHHM